MKGNWTITFFTSLGKKTYEIVFKSDGTFNQFRGDNVVHRGTWKSLGSNEYRFSYPTMYSNGLSCVIVQQDDTVYGHFKSHMYRDGSLHFCLTRNEDQPKMTRSEDQPKMTRSGKQY